MTARSRVEREDGQEEDPTAALPGRRERAKREKRERLVSAARELFAKKGFVATTTSEIAARADIGAGTLFLYVRSKEELLVLVFHEEMGRVRDEAFASLPKKATLLDEVFHAYRALMEYHDRDRTLACVYVKEMAFVREPNRSFLLDFMERLFVLTDARIEAAKSRGEIAVDVPSRILAQNLFAIYFFTLQNGLGEDVSLVSAEHLGMLREGFALSLRGLAPTATTSTKPGGATGKTARGAKA